ncbi:hypothetical protein [Halomonas elongata]|uniref:Uncharacterized protein n=1 Tax=Halomonas elongata (strain ATCC 33173 / DSM 2581 / NBRC 15536 / NCIMB 2198 / 1H9) TaxID=768066 RepID=E1VAF0_HALED|nr:hypothetical protein [Halomonas elongata]WBF19259.1 hypothetical protein LM502_06090 [Halomonas elongata]WPU48119.1 hypothetical protein SR933_04315 [Halomonas elongata DSM 2581]CBV41996.1 uncharacterized protein HELO_2112 [Halomonas elongata DSM 2581]
MSIDPEQLLKLAKDRHGPAGVTLGWPMVINIVDELRRLQWEREALASLATERAQFILNAVELGYCQLPDSDTPDSAHDTYERCKLADSESVACQDAAIRAEGARLAANAVRGLTEVNRHRVADYLEKFADELRCQSEEAPCSSTSPSASPSVSC